MKPQDFDDQDAQAAWELLGRHRTIEPSFGFAERTLRRLHEVPVAKRHFWELPGFRWATALSFVAVISLSGLLTCQHRAAHRSATVYANAHQDTLEDFDVIATLDQLDERQKL